MKNKFFIFAPLFIAAMAALCAANPGSIVATLSEMQSLTDAMELVYLDIGGYVSIENLNDLLSEQTTHDFDNISQGGGTRVIDTTTAFFYPQLQNLSMPPRRWLGHPFRPQRRRADQQQVGAGRHPYLRAGAARAARQEPHEDHFARAGGAVMAAKIRKGDKVIVLTGRDKGRTGEVFEVRPGDNKALVLSLIHISEPTRPY